MVAPEAFRDSRGIDRGAGPLPGGSTQAFQTVDLTVRDIKTVLSSSSAQDPEFLTCLTRDPRSTVRRMGYSALRRTKDLAANEEIFREDGVRFIAGADEAGRGALAGPLAAAAVMLPPGLAIDGINDSKLLKPERREELYEVIMRSALSVSVVFIDPGLIDRFGIQPVNMQALGQALSGVDERCQCAICDHFSIAGTRVPTYGIAKADETFQCVAAASIVAKVERDRVMRCLHRRYPRYSFDENKGYATGGHIAALTAHGPCAVHRLTFASVLPEDDDTLWEAGIDGA